MPANSAERLAECASFGADVRLSPTKEETASLKHAAPKSKKRLPSTMSPINQTITVVYSSQVKTFRAGDSDSDTPEAETMLKAFKDLENQVE